MNCLKFMNNTEELNNLCITISQCLGEAPHSKCNFPVDSIASMTAGIELNEKEKERRKVSLIIHNVPESTLEEVCNRKKEDIQRSYVV